MQCCSIEHLVPVFVSRNQTCFSASINVYINTTLGALCKYFTTILYNYILPINSASVTIAIIHMPFASPLPQPNDTLNSSARIITLYSMMLHACSCMVHQQHAYYYRRSSRNVTLKSESRNPCTVLSVLFFPCHSLDLAIPLFTRCQPGVDVQIMG